MWSPGLEGANGETDRWAFWRSFVKRNPGSVERCVTTLESSISVPTDVLFRDVDGEAVILNLKDGKYYGLDPVGTRMWIVLAEQKQVRAALRILLEEYAVSAEQLEQDLVQFVDKMALHQLFQVNESPNHATGNTEKEE